MRVLPAFGPKGFQVKAGLFCGGLAMLLYATRPSGAAPMETVDVLTVTRPVPLGARVSADALGTDDVPAAVAGDYLAATPENRRKVAGRTAHLPLAAAARLTAPMFLGGLDDDVAGRIPKEHRSVVATVRRVPAGVAPGSRVDLVDQKRRPVADDVLVLALDPFTVAVPNDAVLDFGERDPVEVKARPRAGAGTLTTPPPPRPVRRARPGPEQIAPSK